MSTSPFTVQLWRCIDVLYLFFIKDTFFIITGVNWSDSAGQTPVESGQGPPRVQ